MSYSFGVKAATKAEAITVVRDELTKVVVAQSVHETDQDQAQSAVEAFINLLAEDPTRDVSVSVNGSIWKTEAGVQQASINVNVGFATR